MQLWFLHNALHLYVKFEVTSFYTLEVIPQTKILSKNLQREITRIIAEKSYGSCTMHFSLMRSICE